MKILDAGAGLGRWTKELVKRFPDNEIIALDHKRRLPELGIQFVESSIEQTSFKDNFFDLIIISRVLPYVDEIKTLKELDRIIKPNGIIIHELMQYGYYFYKLLKFQPKRIFNFINAILYQTLQKKLIKKFDNIDSWKRISNYSNLQIAEQISLKKFLGLPMYSLLIMTHNGIIYKKELHDKIKKLARDILNEET